MSVEISTCTERTITFGLGSVTLCEETGTVYFGAMAGTDNCAEVREFARVLEDVAVMMEAYRNE
jgi:hypothetical protein